MARKRSGKSYGDQMRSIADRYRESGQEWPATARQIAGWAIRQELWKPQPSTLIDRCAEELARAMREDYIDDAQGRRVRTKHAARFDEHGRQKVLWADIRTASREHMEVAFQQRRQQIVGDCWQLKMDVDSYNENKSPGRPIQMVFDFTDDLAEMEAVA
jgi:hypothetical protein